MKQVLKSLIRRMGYEVRALPGSSRHELFEEPEVQDYDQLRSFAARVAESSATVEGAGAIRGFRLTGLLRPSPEGSYSRFEIGDERTLSLGVWKRQSPGNEVPFVRDPGRRSEWFYWADQPCIEAKRTRWRVALLGESVARGYFYDPYFNLASALRAMLEHALGPGQIDVVDLARSNLRMPELKACIGQSLALMPDILVIFAGNNWHAHLSDNDIPYVESLLRQDGVPSMKTYLDGKRRQAARTLIVQANRLLVPRNVKIVWVIPEFNLTDWADPVSIAPLLPGAGNAQWRALDRQMTRALRGGDSAHAEMLARQMTELDCGTSSVPLRLLAECSRARGDVPGARRYLEGCREAEGWDPAFSYCPRVFSSIQEALREGSALPGNAVVDLPEVFSLQTEDGLPGRRLFLDYCHMTSEGINVASAEIAARVASLIADSRPSAASFLSRAPGPPPEIEGRACFLAAAHNAAFHQKVDIVKYFCDRALRLWPDCAPLMRHFADYATRDLPMMICRSGLEFDTMDRLDTRRYLGHGRQRRLDLIFGDAAAASLAEIGTGIGDEFARLRIKEHSPGSRPKELVEFFHSAAIPALSERCWISSAFTTNHGSRCMYASAFWEASKFVFFAEQGQDIDISFTYRAPLLPPWEGTVTVDLNGHRIGELPAKQAWRTERIRVPKGRIADGLNEILVTWPTEEPPSEILLAEAANRLLMRQLPYFFRVFGEVHSLSVTDRSAKIELNSDEAIMRDHRETQAGG